MNEVKRMVHENDVRVAQRSHNLLIQIDNRITQATNALGENTKAHIAAVVRKMHDDNVTQQTTARAESQQALADTRAVDQSTHQSTIRRLNERARHFEREL